MSVSAFPNSTRPDRRSEDLDIEYVLGSRSEKLVELPQILAGTYKYTCEVPGHEDMEGTLMVD